MLHTKFRVNRSTGSGEDFLKVFYHIWAWRQSWSFDQPHDNKFSFPCTEKLTYKIWLKWPSDILEKQVLLFICK